jgi:hypothetical protein
VYSHWIGLAFEFVDGQFASPGRNPRARLRLNTCIIDPRRGSEISEALRNDGERRAAGSPTASRSLARIRPQFPRTRHDTASATMALCVHRQTVAAVPARVTVEY